VNSVASDDRAQRLRAQTRFPAAVEKADSSALPFFFLLLYVAVVYLRPFEYRQYVQTFENVPIIPTLMLLMLASWLFVGRKDFSVPQYGLMAALVCCVSISTLTGMRWPGGVLPTFFDFLPLVIFFFVAASTLDSPTRLRIMFMLFGAVSTIIAWHGIDQAANEIGWSGALPNQGRITYVGFLNDPNDLAMAMLMAMPMVLSFARGWRSPVSTMIALAAASVLGYAVFLTNSRGGMVAALAMLAVYSVGRFGWRKSLLVAPPLLATAIAFAPARFSEISPDEESAEGRVEAWYSGFEMLREYPLFGVGKGGFVEHHVRTAHNSYVLALAELGLVGFFVWLSLIAISAAMLFKLGRMSPPESGDESLQAEWREHRRLGLILVYSLVACLTAAFFLSRAYVIILYLLVAMIVGLYQSASRRLGGLPGFEMRLIWKRLLQLEVATVFLLWLTTRVLLQFN
jgi:O-antigen ligase